MRTHRIHARDTSVDKKMFTRRKSQRGDKVGDGDAVTELMEKSLDLDRELEKQAHRRSRGSGNIDISGSDRDRKTIHFDNNPVSSVSALDRFRAAQNASKVQYEPSSSSVDQFEAKPSEVDETVVRSSSTIKTNDRVSEAGASYGKAGALLDRLMGKSKLQQAAAAGYSDDDAKDYEDEVHVALNRQSGNQEHSNRTSSKLKRTTRYRDGRSQGKKKMSNFLQSWPYDDYENDYDALISVASVHPANNNDNDEGEDLNTDLRAYKDDALVRPSELPTVKVAVKNLPLTSFEEVAEKRATAIISTWIYDSGLIDELLVSGSRSANVLTPTYVSSDKSMKSHEGIELGTAAPKASSELKMEREIDRLRRATEQELSFVNSRLNDGVASSGAEVQELVQAVSETKGEIAHLRKMFSYISKGGDSKEGEFLLADYPKLRHAIHARKNLFRCFRDLDFFANIPSTCTRLRDELSAAEYTPHEYITIRKVSMEHVDLEVMMVEADAGLRGKLGASDQGTEVYIDDNGLNVNASDKQSSLKEVDHFLAGHQKNVASLGKEIRERVITAIGSAYEMALENSSGLVALVEAVETYEVAALEYAKKSEFDAKYVTKFNKMRKDALRALHQSFKRRCVDVFSNIQMMVRIACNKFCYCQKIILILFKYRLLI